MKKKFIVFILCLALLLGLTAVFSGCSKQENKCVYKINAEYDTAGIVNATMDFTYVNTTENEIKNLKFNIFPNAFRQDASFLPVSSIYHSAAYYSGNSYGNMEIKEVKGGDSWEITGEDKNILSVTLQQSVYPDEKVNLTIVFSVTLARVNHRTGITQKAINLGNFYPILCAYEEGNGFYECVYYSDGDPFYSECADYIVNFTAPSSYVVASSGELIKSSKQGECTTYEYSLKNSRDFALVLSNQFEIKTQKVENVTVNYYYYQDANAQESLMLACNSLQWFSENIGDYLYSTYSVVQTGFCYGGMEYPALVLISDKQEKAEYNYTIVHETAHQWWYAAVGNNQLENAWMDEGLGEYCTALYYDAHSDLGRTKEQLVNGAMASYKAFYSIYSQLFGEADTTMNRCLKDYISEYEYTNIAYNKGMILFSILEKDIGENRFKAGLKDYYTRYQGEIAKPEDMIACFRRTGVDVEGLFRSFIEGKAVI